MTLLLLPESRASDRCQPRYATKRNPDRETLGGDVASIATQLGKSFMPWQRDLADVAYEIDPRTGLLWYSEIVVLIMRQQGKSTFVIPAATHRAIAWKTRQNILYLAQTRKAARKKWEREQLYTLENSPFGRKLMLPPRKSNGDESMLFRNGSTWGIDAPNEDGGVGDTLGMGIIDEAWKFADATVEQSISPTMLTVEDSQKYILSTAGTARSKYLKKKVDAGRIRTRSGLESRSLYLEYSFPEDCDIYDPAVWWDNMPALGHTVTEEKIRAEAETMNDDDEFKRAYGNIFLDKLQAEWAIPEDDWMAVADRDSEIVGPVTWCADVSPDMAASSISIAGQRRDGLIHIECVEQLDGTSWLPSRMAELQREYGGRVFGDLSGPIGGLIHRFEDEGVHLEPISGPDMQKACGSLYEAVLEKRIRHINQPEINIAVSIAAKSRTTDAWRWTRGRSLGDISPLVSATVAYWKLLETLPDLNYDPLAGIY
jgi:hypothetical protein